MSLKKQIEWEMRRVPRLGEGWKFIPLYSMPRGTELEFTASYVPPIGPERDQRQVNNKDEVDVLCLPEGTYRLLVESWPTLILSPKTLPQFELFTKSSVQNKFNLPDDQIRVKPLNPLLAPSSVFEANVDVPKLERKNRDDTWSTTFRLTTGTISAILVLGTRFVLSVEDEKYAQRSQPQRYYKRKRRSRTGSHYVPLRKLK